MHEQNGEAFRSRLSSQVEIVPAKEGNRSGSIRYPRPKSAAVVAATHYVACPITLPTQLASGSYELHLTQKDEVSGRTTSSAIALVLQP